MKHYQQVGHLNRGVSGERTMGNCCNIAHQSNISLPITSTGDQLGKTLHEVTAKSCITWGDTKQETRSMIIWDKNISGAKWRCNRCGDSELVAALPQEQPPKQHQHSFKSREMFCCRLAHTPPALIHLSLVFWSAEHLPFPLISVGVEGTQCFRKASIMHEQTCSEEADAPQSQKYHQLHKPCEFPPEQSLKCAAL